MCLSAFYIFRCKPFFNEFDIEYRYNFFFFFFDVFIILITIYLLLPLYFQNVKYYGKIKARVCIGILNGYCLGCNLYRMTDINIYDAKYIVEARAKYLDSQQVNNLSNKNAGK
jgi:hypothetical protein